MVTDRLAAGLGAVHALVHETEDIAATLGLDSVCAPLRSHVGQLDTPNRPTVVVVGETKRGKSRLINELIGVTGLSPVDVDVATGLWVRFDTGPGAARVVLADGTARDVTIDEAQRSMVSAERSPKSARPIGAIVHVPSGLLDAVTLVDTPGVGGLGALHREITLGALQAATALLFVTDSTSPISQVELDFLAEAREQISELLFVITKVDLEPAWHQVMIENQRLVRRAVPALANAVWIAVSSERNERARNMAADTTSERVAQLARDSGIGDVRDWLANFARQRAGITRARNVVRHVESTLLRLDQLLVDQLQELADDSALERAQQRDLTARASIQQQVQTWRERVPSELQRVRAQAAAALSAEVARVHSAAADRVDRNDPGWRQAADDFEEGLATAVHAVLQRFGFDAHDAIREVVGERNAADPSLHVAIASAREAAFDAARKPVAVSSGHERNSFGTGDVVELFGNTTSVAEATQLVGTFLSPVLVSRHVLRTSADLLFPGLGVLLGLCLAGVHHRVQGRARDQRTIREVLFARASEVGNTMLRDLDVRYDQMTHVFSVGCEAWSRQRVAEIDVSIDRAARARRARQGQIDAEKAEVERNRTTLATALQKAADLSESLAVNPSL